MIRTVLNLVAGRHAEDPPAERRSPQWPPVERAFLRAHPECRGCGSRRNLNAHHLVPFHVDRAKELDPDNLVAVCRSCHFVLCHRNDWSNWEPDAPRLLDAHRARTGARPFGSAVRAAAALFLAAGLTAIAAAPASSQSVVVPYNAAVYGQPGGFTAADAKRVVELLESVDRRLEALEKAAGGAAVRQAPGAELLAVAARHCAACHTPAAGDAKGGGFILFAGDDLAALKPLGSRERIRVKEAVLSGQMPPPSRPKLSPAEKRAFE